MKTSKESGLDYNSHETEWHASAEMGIKEDDEERGSYDVGEGVEGKTTVEKPEPGPGGDGPKDPQTGSEEPEEASRAAEGPATAHPGPVEGRSAVETEGSQEYLVSRTSHRARPRLSRMERVQSSWSLSSSEDNIHLTHRFVMKLCSSILFLFARQSEVSHANT